MKFRNYIFGLAGSIMTASATWAEAPNFPPLPEFPQSDAPFNPMNPLGNPLPITPIEPTSNIDAGGSDAASLPNLPALPPDDFDFFQPGAQVTQLPPLPDNSIPSAPLMRSLNRQEPSANGKTAGNPHARPYRKRFNYKIQSLPAALYKNTYHPQNRHLPTAQTESSYDMAAFNAAANNDVNGLRAMLTHGERSLNLRNAQGETLADVAERYGATSTLRYLVAIGAPQS